MNFINEKYKKNEIQGKMIGQFLALFIKISLSTRWIFLLKKGSRFNFQTKPGNWEVEFGKNNDGLGNNCPVISNEIKVK